VAWVADGGDGSLSGCEKAHRLMLFGS
jgi:hypothetical protein